MENHNGNGASEKVAAMGGTGRSRSEVGLRVAGMVLTLVAAVVLGVDKQTKVIPVSVVSTLPPLNVPVTAKWHYLSAFVYFVVVNAAACAYGAISLVVALGRRGGGNRRGIMAVAIALLDVVMVALLFSGNGAAAAIGVMGYKGNSHVRWEKVCNAFGKFCHQVAAGIVLSLLGSVAFLLLPVISALEKKT
ncbi:CASP-like protein 1E1 [Diospyros lotus]|uniref:CASP-like protein 1E1 n=1 Tax=Diospyros lotus TaxID=55363 RepID=UPI0022522574|nr:CASP-like protein 1E1 [Diospyros lotus]